MVPFLFFLDFKALNIIAAFSLFKIHSHIRDLHKKSLVLAALSYHRPFLDIRRLGRAKSGFSQGIQVVDISIVYLLSLRSLSTTGGPG